MDNMQKHSVKLPPFVIDSELSWLFSKQLQNFLGRTSENIVFDWSEVCFFDDYTLLKLIFIQRQLRILENRVSNSGFRFAFLDPNKQAVLRQLWAVGLPEFCASGHLFGSKHLKDVLKDDAELLESDPLRGLQWPAPASAVIPMLCCHDRKHFAAGSREEKQLDSFIRSSLRPSGANSSWDLVENRKFRHLMLQQLRRNVHEHSRSDGGDAIGLAIVRVWTSRSLPDEWSLKEDMQFRLLQVWNKAPVPSLIQKTNTDIGVLQISVLDNGAGIPRGLDIVHEKLIFSAEQKELFSADNRLHYVDEKLDREFAEPASWSDKNARLIAFAMDQLGTSKYDRANEVKGLQYLRENAVLGMGGAACIESDGAAVSQITRIHSYGQPQKLQFAWCKTGGAGICLAVPMHSVNVDINIQKITAQTTDFRGLALKGSSTGIFKVRDSLPLHPDSGHFESNELMVCAKSILDAIILRKVEEDITKLRRKGLLVVDWGELRESKRLFHTILAEIAKVLSDTDPKQMRPFVFVNLPKGLCGLLGTAISMYSKLGNPIPICTFTAEHREPFWLGLDGENSIPDEIRKKILCDIQRKLTDQKENRTEAFYRGCLTQILTNRSSKPLSLIDTFVRRSVQNEDFQAIQKSQAYFHLDTLIRRCSLFRAEKQRSRDGNEIEYTGRFQSVFSLGEIESETRSLFLNEFREVFTKPPVCFNPTNEKEGVRLLHSTRVVKRYFRSDALVDSPIAMELTQELTSIAFDIARQLPSRRIEWVVSCTSPLHWFVHKIVDGLTEYGIICSHHVFASYEEIHTSIDEIGIRTGENVLVFTDVIASGQTAYQIADSLTKRFNVKMAGLIALADIRTKEDRESGPDLDGIYSSNIVCLYNDPEPHCPDLRPAYYVHPETVVPKRVTSINPVDEFFEKNYSGTGPLIENHGYFNDAKRSLDLMTSIGAVRFGHYQHGSHHSEVFVDVEKILSCREYRNLMVTALFQYIISNDIRLVVYPNHSSSYILADDLKQRFVDGDLLVEFTMACRTYRGRGTQGTSYTLTRFTPHPDPVHWNKFSEKSVLILDDAVCSGTTVESIIAELARIDCNYYDKQFVEVSHGDESKFSIHVVAFLNRLPRVSGDFWKGLAKVAAGRIHFSTFLCLPLAADSEELCPQCRQIKELEHAKNSIKYCLYAKEFLSWWIIRSEVLYSHERRHFDKRQNDENQREERFSSYEAIRIAGYLSAIERKAYKDVLKNLFSDPRHDADAESISVRVHVRSRAGFLYGLLNGNSSEEMVTTLCKELEALIDMSLDKNGYLPQNGKDDDIDDTLEILQVLTLRYIRMRPTQNEVERVFSCLLMKLAKLFNNRLVAGGVASVLDSCLICFMPPERTENEWRNIRNSLKENISQIDRKNMSEKAALMIDWFVTYLSEGEKRINSIGDAVKMLAEFAKKGRRNHFYGRHEVDELVDIFNLRPGEGIADGAPENIRRTQACTGIFSDLLKATRVLQSVSKMEEELLKVLQTETEQDIQELRRLCNCLNGSEMLTNYLKVKTIFLRNYKRWFPGEGERCRAVDVIGNFTPNLSNTLNKAWERYSPVRRSKDAIKMNMDDLLQHSSVRVLIDPTVLSTAMIQLIDNVDKLAEQDSTATIKCRVCLPEASAQATGIAKIKTGHVGILVSNTGTPRPMISQIKLRGLSAVKMRLNEYGGNLAYIIPETEYSFEVMLKLLVWTEEDI